MVPVRTLIQMALFLGFRPFGLGALGLAPLGRSLLLLGVMRMDLLVILAARTAEEEQDRLSVRTAHAASLRRWRVVVKRTTLIAGGHSLG